ncbi:hypothetical protein PHISCL_06884 [Aspergillus sclerotialis]|uniref:Serine-rich protein n=1 Tax=Aspergillus sclerotialis TaxID=2070753 RepID=A0A3A2ZDV7_9EURO|nr:hypothetical protein PHISCL_06884 [Aspergillus sclerotialis]
MRSTIHSTNPSSNRRALHERTPSQTNEHSSTPSMRLVYDEEHDMQDQDHMAFYYSTPYPTKPEHILPPNPGKGQGFVSGSTNDGGELPDRSTSNFLSDSSLALDRHFIDRSISDPWDLSSTVDPGNTPSQGWEEDPGSSRSSFPDPDLPTTGDHKPNWDSEGSFSDDEMVVLPTGAPTIKTVVSETSSRQSPPPRPANPAPSSSSPNMVPIGIPSSPNFVALDNSSMNVVQIGSSPNPDSGRSNSLASLTSFGTVVRNYNAARWIHSSSPERSNSRSHSFRSSPPYQSVASVRSASIHPSRDRSHSRSATSSSRSENSSDIQAIIDSGVTIQYPTIRGPSSSSWVDTSQSTFPENSSQDLSQARSSDRFNSHLSTVPSQWSGECHNRVLSPVDESFDNSTGEPSRPSAALVRQKPASSSVWLVTESERREHLDNLTNLPMRSTNPGLPSLSSGSRQSSLRSNRRPGTGSSFVLNTIPVWAKVYYGCDGRIMNSAFSLIDGSRPSSARPLTPNSNALGHLPTAFNRPPPRTKAICQTAQQRVSSDPRDPRSHWVEDPEPEEATPSETSRDLPTSWSPHLFPDRVILRNVDNVWTAPSLDSAAEPIFGRRNVQVYAFCFGFICPITWFVASFLRLPPKPELDLEEVGPQLEFALQVRLFDISRRRYENARWWRNLNRWMTPLGLVIITIIITLAAVGTTMGF